MKMSIDELEAAWNAQADAMNQWDELGIDEIVDFAQEQMREACAHVCAQIGAEKVHGCSDAYLEGRQMAAIRCKNAINAL